VVPEVTPKTEKVTE